MKAIRNFILIVLLSTVPISGFCGGGDSYRYKVRIVLANEQESFLGYIYYGTFDSGYTKDHGLFKDFVVKNFKDSLLVFQEIKSMKRENIDTDFAIKENAIRISKHDILKIDLLAEKKYPLGEGLDYLNEAEYNIIRPNPKRIETVHYSKVQENCSYIFISWGDDKELEDYVNELNEKFDELLAEEKFQEFNSYLKKLRSKAVKSDILLYQHCGMM